MPTDPFEEMRKDEEAKRIAEEEQRRAEEAEERFRKEFREAAERVKIDEKIALKKILDRIRRRSGNGKHERHGRHKK